MFWCRVDYLMRDSKMCGVRTSCDYDRVMQHIKVPISPSLFTWGTHMRGLLAGFSKSGGICNGKLVCVHECQNIRCGLSVECRL